MIDPSALLTELHFMKSRVVLTAAELDVFTFFHRKEPASARELAEERGLNLRATTRLLDCLVTLDLLEKHGNHYCVTERGVLFSSDHPDTLLPMVLHTSNLWSRWSALTDIVRHGSEAQPRREERTAKEQEVFIDAMHVVARALSKEIADAYDTRRFKKLLDVGGGSGTYTAAFLKKNPQLKAVLFDLQEVVWKARERLQVEGLLDRVALVGGDFYKDELPPGCDLAFVSAIIHQNSPEQNIDLFRKIYRALVPGGFILIRDHIMDETRTYPPAGAMFALNMLVNTQGGDTYTFSEVKACLEAAGFSKVTLVKWGEKMDSLVEGRKPA